MHTPQQPLEQQALEFAKLLAQCYFTDRSTTGVLAYMAENVSWIGTGLEEYSQNLEQATQSLAAELNEYGGSFQLTKQDLHAVACSEDVCVVYGAYEAIPQDPSLTEQNLRVSIVVKRDETGLKLQHLHLSHPDQDLEKNHYYVSKAARTHASALRTELDYQEQRLENMTRNFPGGAHQCKNDGTFSLISMSDSFLTMFGYTHEEIQTLFHGKFLEMICPEDREQVLFQTQEQLKKGNSIELEYRVPHKNGSLVWVLDKGRLLNDGYGSPYFYCLLIEIGDRKREQEELRLSVERYQVIMDQATDIIFEWDIPKDTLTFSSNWYKKFGYEPISKSISQKIPLSANVHPDDIPAFVKIMKETAAGKPYSETEFRIMDASGTFYWCRIRATAQYNSMGKAIKAVGVIVDIDQEKKQKQELLDMAQRDSLTGLYNKAAMASLVSSKMETRNTSQLSALLILDVDHFKSVNDIYGHLAGDSLLSDVAQVLRTHVRSTDLVGRVGGDEFAVFLSELKDEATTERKVQELLRSLQMLIPERGAPPITCSIGVALTHHGELPYKTLYKYADLALYYQKENGRNGITFFSPSLLNQETPTNALPTAVGEEMVSQSHNILNELLAQYAFQTLYASADTELALNRLLEIIGRSYDVSRAYIFESSADGRYCSNTFEWCATGISSQIHILQNLAYIEDLGDYQKNFDKDGLFYCSDVLHTHPDLRAVLEPQGIRSMLQCAIWDEGNFLGYVGFDECRENKKWSTQQVAAFKLTADVLSSFLVKLRLKQKYMNLLSDGSSPNP